MKFIPSIIFSLALASSVAVANAMDFEAGGKESSAVGVRVTDISRSESGDITARLDLDLSRARFKGNEEIVVTPMWVNTPDTLRLTSFAVAGRNRWYDALRNGTDIPYLFKGWDNHELRVFRDFWPSVAMNPTGLTAVNELSYTTRYLPWMETATFLIDVEQRGCASCMKKNKEGTYDEYYALAQTDFVPKEYTAEFVYVTPVAEVVKSREVSGRAFIDVKVNQTNIIPDYLRNASELAKIMATIDSVKSDKDITVTSLAISGTASPEGSYANNVRLAKGRTEALSEYVRKLNDFPKGFIKETYEPVDWKGLAEWLSGNIIDNGEAILAIVEGDLPPEQRNNKIKTTYPTQYKWLLDNVYPSLRHSDYSIEFTIRTFTSVEEILEVMATAPQKLSLAELFKAASSQPEGSELYTEAFEIAVRMFPEDPAANLNAGIAALKRGDYAMAQRYFAKAGNSDEARYEKALLAALQGDYDTALSEFRLLQSSSVPSVATAAMNGAAQIIAIQNAKTWQELE